MSEDYFKDEVTVLEDIGNDNAVENTTDIKKCNACGANLIWSAADKCLICEHCGNQVKIDLNKFGEELNFAAMLKGNNSWAAETHIYQCSNCGAKEILNKDEIAVKCAFCGTTNVVKSEEIAGLKPNAVIPFNLNKDSACERVIKWAKKKIFAPSAFKKSVVPEEMSGHYNPVFTFDTDTSTEYRGVLGEYYYVTTRVGGKSVSHRRTRYKYISGIYRHSYDDIVIQASSIISQETIDKLQPFSTNNCNEYSKDFLHGFTASQYTKDGESCWSEARGFIDIDVKRKILAKYSYDFVKSFNHFSSCNNITFKYILLPIYVGHCKWRQKIYNFFINGRSGRVTGKTPLSAIRVGIASFFFTCLAIGLGVLAWWLAGN